MKSTQRPMDETELHAYVDGRLEPQQRKEVEAWLAEHPEEARRVAEYERQNAAMQSLFDPILEEPVPQRLHIQTSRPGVPIFRYAAMLALFVFGGVLGWVVHGLVPQQQGAMPATASLPARAIMAHAVYAPEVLHPVEVRVEQEAHLIKWLSKRLGKELHAPHLNSLGYEMVGGRLLPGDDGPAAQFMYENAQGKRLTLYIKGEAESSGETAFRYERKDGISVFYWVDGALGYALSGEVEKEGLLKAANAVYRGLNL
jgi:anti-sigma factor RsiW